jgi:hypothetical protein
MTLVSQTLSRLAVGAPERHRNLTIIPLLDGKEGASPYLTLHDALEAGLLEITEVSEAGSVPTLQARNKGDRGVLILDGEELVGAKRSMPYRGGSGPSVRTRRQAAASTAS